MRTTVNIDPRTLDALRNKARESGRRLSEIFEWYLLLGLETNQDIPDLIEDKRSKLDAEKELSDGIGWYADVPGFRSDIVLPDHWIIYRCRNSYGGNFDGASRLDGVNVGRNGRWFANGGPLPEKPLLHFESYSMEECCQKVDSTFRFKAPAFPRLARFLEEGMPYRSDMAFMLVYGLKSIKDGLYEIDGVKRTSEPEKQSPENPEWGARQLYRGTLTNIFSDKVASHYKGVNSRF